LTVVAKFACQNSLQIQNFYSNVVVAFRMLNVVKEMPAYDCSSRCQAPDEFFSGMPWIAIPKNKILNLKPG
jgi:hypothetical protein